MSRSWWDFGSSPSACFGFFQKNLSISVHFIELQTQQAAKGPHWHFVLLSFKTHNPAIYEPPSTEGQLSQSSLLSLAHSAWSQHQAAAPEEAPKNTETRFSFKKNKVVSHRAGQHCHLWTGSGCPTVVNILQPHEGSQQPQVPRLMLLEMGAVPQGAAETGQSGFSVRAVINYKPPEHERLCVPQTKESSVLQGGVSHYCVVRT